MEGRLNILHNAFLKGFGFAAGVLALWGTVLLAQSMNSFVSGRVVSASELNANFTAVDGRLTSQDTRLTAAEASITKIAPVGTILAWHKNLGGGAPALPDGWMECNGQPVADAESPFDGANLPDLNNQRRFLRGNPTSGPLEVSQFAQHTHENNIWVRPGMAIWSDFGNGQTSLGFVFGGIAGLNNSAVAVRPNVGFAGTPGETRPINMSVVWIIRVK